MRIVKNPVKNALANKIACVVSDGYSLMCPTCKNERIIKTRESLRRALSSTMKCNGCSKIGTHINKKLSESTRLNMSQAQKKRYTNDCERVKTGKLVKTAMNRPDVRIRHINALHKSDWIKVKTDYGQVELIKKWNSIGFSFNINHQLKTENDLFYLDGYDSSKNVIIEYDSEYHNKPSQRFLDKQRQDKIIKILNPSVFWRYNSKEKKFTDVYRKQLVTNQ